MKTSTSLQQSRFLILLFAIWFQSSFTLIAQTSTFYQLNFIYGSDTITHSEWGALDITFTGTLSYQYINLSVDTAWAIQNLPVISIQGPSVSQTQRFWFPLPDSGVVISSIVIGISLTDSTKVLAPALTDTVNLSQYEYVIGSGTFSGGGGTKNEAGKAKNQIGAAAITMPPSPTHAAFPNQETLVNDCALSGVSNSLNYLNSVHPGLNLPLQACSIDTLRQKLGWTPTGVPRQNWAANKRAHTEKRKMRIKTITGGQGTIIHVPQQLADKQDIEIDAKKKGKDESHVMAIVGCVLMADGKYAITVRHDGQQGEAGGLVTETGIYDPKTGDLTGALASYKEFFIVVECPVPEKPQPSAKQPKPGKSIKSSGGISGSPGGMPATAINEKIQLKNMVLNNFSDSISIPALFATDSVAFSASAVFELSLDTGHTFTTYSAVAACKIRYHHTNDIGPTKFIETEMVQLDLSGGTLPSTVLFRENPTITSTGFIQQTPAGPGIYAEASFIHVNIEMSTNSGSNWIPFDHILLLEADNTSGVASIPAYSTLGLITLGILILSISIFFIRAKDSG